MSSSVGVDIQSPTTIYAYDTTGQQRWAEPIVGQVSQLQATDTALYASAEIKGENGFLLPGSVYALQTSNGHVLWQHHLEQSINGITLTNNVLYLNLSTNTDSTEIQALSANNGQHIWQKTVANGIVYGPKFLGADLYIAISNRILLLNTTNGQTLKTLPIPKEVQGFLEPFTPIFIV